MTYTIKIGPENFKQFATLEEAREWGEKHLTPKNLKRLDHTSVFQRPSGVAGNKEVGAAQNKGVLKKFGANPVIGAVLAKAKAKFLNLLQIPSLFRNQFINLMRRIRVVIRKDKNVSQTDAGLRLG